MKQNIWRRIGALMLAVALTFSLTLLAMADEADDTTESKEDELTVTLSTESLTLKVGAVGELEVSKIVDSTAQEIDQSEATITWSSSDNDTATVANGKVTAVAVGTAEITVTVEVTPSTDSTPPPTDTTPPSTDTTQTPTPTQTSTPTPTPGENENENNNGEGGGTGGNGSTEEEDIPTVQAEEEVKTLRGTATCSITVTEVTEDTTTSANPSQEPDVNPSTAPTSPAPSPTVEITGVSVSRMAYTFNNRDPLKLTASVSPSRTAPQDVTWSSTQTGVATVGDDGTVTPVGPGVATITATSVADTTKSATCTVTVSGIVLAGEDMKTTGGKNTLTIMEGQSSSLSVTSYGAATGRATWESSDNTVLTVATGRVTARAIGTATVTATVGGYPATCEVTVVENTAGLLETKIAQNDTLSFSSLRSQLNSVCRRYTDGGRSLSYLIGLSVPTSAGILHYEYASADDTGFGVGSTEKYYYIPTLANQRAIANITFVPKSDFNGVANISYTAVSESGEYISGTIRVTVGGSSTSTNNGTSTSGIGPGSVYYSATAGTRIDFLASSFNTACQLAIGENLDYVRFFQPSSSAGTLYYNYTGTNRSEISSSTRYYRSYSPSISNITFVPTSSSVTEVVIDFTGYGNSGTRFDGTVTISYSGGGTVSGQIPYSVRSGSAVKFNSDDFNKLCIEATDANLDYITFDTLPSSLAGILYYNYDSSTNPGSRMTTSTRCYLNSSPDLSRVAFVAANNYTGTVSLQYTGTATNGSTFKGTVEIQVYTSTVDSIRYMVDGSLPVELTAANFRRTCNAVLEEGLSYVQFTSLPSTSEGRLYSNYTGYRTGSQVTIGSRYYLDGNPGLDLTFVPKAGFEGTIFLNYIGVDIAGGQVIGTVAIVISGNGTSGFSDLGNYGWAASSVEFLRSSGIVNGISSTEYGPQLPMLRRDFVLMLCRAFGFKTESQYSFPDVPAGSYYAWAVATAKDLGIVAGDENGLFRPDAELTRQDAMVLVQRAMRAAGLSVPNGTGTNLAFFSDSGQISDYASNAVSSMVLLGVMQGDSGRLMPRSSITRAEMAVLLHRIMTL